MNESVREREQAKGRAYLHGDPILPFGLVDGSVLKPNRPLSVKAFMSGCERALSFPPRHTVHP